MKVLHLLKSDKFSGAENVVLTIMDSLKDIDMVYASMDGPIRQVVESRGFCFYPLEAPSVSAVKKAIDEIQPDVIHAHDFSMATIAAWGAGKIPVVAHLHNNPLWLRKPSLQSIALALALSRIRYIISVSNAIEDEYIFRSLFAEKNIVISNVVDAENVINRSLELCDVRKTDLVFLGRLTAQKCPLLFCQIVNEIRKIVPGITARMIGDGELRTEVENYIENNCLSANIELVGFQSNPYPQLNAGGIMVMPSAWEGFGLAAVEGLCLGKPIVCSGVGGLADIIDDSCGAKCQSIDEYRNAILRLLQDERMYQNVSKGARMRSKEYTNVKCYAEKIRNVYVRALGS